MSTKLQKAGRTFLLRLVAEYGPRGAARILRMLADEIDAASLEARAYYSWFACPPFKQEY